MPPKGRRSEGLPASSGSLWWKDDAYLEKGRAAERTKTISQLNTTNTYGLRAPLLVFCAIEDDAFGSGCVENAEGIFLEAVGGDDGAAFVVEVEAAVIVAQVEVLLGAEACVAAAGIGLACAAQGDEAANELPYFGLGVCADGLLDGGCGGDGLIFHFFFFGFN